MHRFWFNPTTDYSLLQDGYKYYVRLYDYEFVSDLMQWELATNQFKSIATSEGFLYTAVNRVSEQI